MANHTHIEIQVPIEMYDELVEKYGTEQIEVLQTYNKRKKEVIAHLFRLIRAESDNRVSRERAMIEASGQEVLRSVLFLTNKLKLICRNNRMS